MNFALSGPPRHSWILTALPVVGASIRICGGSTSSSFGPAPAVLALGYAAEAPQGRLALEHCPGADVDRACRCHQDQELQDATEGPTKIRQEAQVLQHRDVEYVDRVREPGRGLQARQDPVEQRGRVREAEDQPEPERERPEASVQAEQVLGGVDDDEPPYGEAPGEQGEDAGEDRPALAVDPVARGQDPGGHARHVEVPVRHRGEGHEVVHRDPVPHAASEIQPEERAQGQRRQAEGVAHGHDSEERGAAHPVEHEHPGRSEDPEGGEAGDKPCRPVGRVGRERWDPRLHQPQVRRQEVPALRGARELEDAGVDHGAEGVERVEGRNAAPQQPDDAGEAH
mmetsp:Transcript_62033/g.174907  ORF Transcript_62033/g.174907 Transcript_62033/m.174907 type:complete len:341 (+) Transcript_62033:138-1160(+)